MKKEPVLKTKRLILRPAADAQIEAMITAQTDPTLKQAYSEMLEGCRSDPENRLWYTPWTMYLKSDPETAIGDLGFKGPQTKGTVEIGYGVEKPFEGNGYTTEGAKALIEWAFSQQDVYIIKAETDPDNAASQRVLEKLEFKPAGEGEEGPCFRLEKPESAYMAIGMCFGLSIGMAFGASSGHSAYGLSIGLPIGMAIGLALDQQEKKHRQEVCG